MSKTKMIGVRVDQEMYDLVNAYAAAYGTTASKFVYQHLLKKLPKEIPSVPQPTVEI